MAAADSVSLVVEVIVNTHCLPLLEPSEAGDVLEQPVSSGCFAPGGEHTGQGGRTSGDTQELPKEQSAHPHGG